MSAAAPATNGPTTLFPFFQLPAEIRNLIYRELLLLDDGQANTAHPQLLATTPQAHDEARGLIFSLNQPVIDVYALYHDTSRRLWHSCTIDRHSIPSRRCPRLTFNVLYERYVINFMRSELRGNTDLILDRYFNLLRRSTNVLRVLHVNFHLRADDPNPRLLLGNTGTWRALSQFRGLEEVRITGVNDPDTVIAGLVQRMMS